MTSPRISAEPWCGPPAPVASPPHVSGPMLWRQPAQAGSPLEEQVHLQFGSDAAAREMTVTWATDTSVARPRIRLGTPGGGLGSVIEAETSAKGR